MCLLQEITTKHDGKRPVQTALEAVNTGSKKRKVIDKTQYFLHKKDRNIGQNKLAAQYSYLRSTRDTQKSNSINLCPIASSVDVPAPDKHDNGLNQGCAESGPFLASDFCSYLTSA